MRVGETSMDRKSQLIKCLGAKADLDLTGNLIDEIIFLEQQLDKLMKLPFIKVHPDTPELQKTAPAAKLFTQLSSQYNSALRTLVSMTGGDVSAEDSPLRKWAKEYAHK